MLACIRTCRMVGRHAVPCVQGGRGGGSICRGVRRGPERTRPGWANQTNKKNLSGLSVGVASNRRCHVGEGRGPNAILSGREGLAVASHLHPSVRGNVREDAWLSPLEAVGHALCHCIRRFLSHRPGTSQAFVPGGGPIRAVIACSRHDLYAGKACPINDYCGAEDKPATPWMAKRI